MHRRTILSARHLRTAPGEPTPGSPAGGGGTTGQPATPVAPPADENGFPANTPIANMSAEQQAAYWRHQSRKHEQRAESRADYDTLKTELDALKATHQTDAEKAAEAAAKTARAEGESAARAIYAPRLVDAEFKSRLAGHLKPDQIAVITGALDHTKFLTATGEVDTDKVTQYAAGLAPGGRWPDTGQGNRGDTGATGKGVAAGADMFAASRGKKTN